MCAKAQPDAGMSGVFLRENEYLQPASQDRCCNTLFHGCGGKGSAP